MWLQHYVVPFHWVLGYEKFFWIVLPIYTSHWEKVPLRVLHLYIYIYILENKNLKGSEQS